LQPAATAYPASGSMPAYFVSEVETKVAIEIYDQTVPVFRHMMAALDGLLRKAEADAEARNIDPQVFLQGRLAPDMLPFTRQIQIATDQVKGGLSRLAGLESPKWPDDEQTFADLHARIDKAVQYAKSFEPKQFDGAETRNIELKFPNATLEFRGKDYLLSFVLPNLYFHITTAYLILRHNGVQIGKRDFMGG
jgi:uncharacterized protein